jgi:predicted NAD/FAD-binding protein
MSFSVQVKSNEGRVALEWSGTGLSGLFAQRSNLLNWRFMNMLRDLNRFNQLCSAIAEAGDTSRQRQTLGEFLNSHQFSQEFRDWYFLPMVACIWSCPTEQMLRFPVATMIRFCHNHGLLQLRDRPQWWTVSGGARHYVDRIVAQIPDKRLNTPVLAIERLERMDRALAPAASGVKITTKTGVEIFDKVIIATHPDQALAMLQVPSPLELRTLGAIRYHANRAVLHTDESVLPGRRAAWENDARCLPSLLDQQAAALALAAKCHRFSQPLARSVSQQNPGRVCVFAPGV